MDVYIGRESYVPGRPNDPFGGCSDVTRRRRRRRRQALSVESAPPVKKEDPDREATVSFLGLLHYRLPPTILFPYSGEKEKKRNLSLSLSPDATTEIFDSIFDSFHSLASDERIVDFQPVLFRFAGMRKSRGNRGLLSKRTQYRGHASMKRASANTRDSCEDRYNNSHGCNRLCKPQGCCAG